MLAAQLSSYSLALIFIGVSVTQLVLAFLVGCWYGQSIRARKKFAAEYERAAQALLHLHEWTASIGDSVDAHQSEVQASARQLEQILQEEADNWKPLAVSVVHRIASANERLTQQLKDAEKRLNEQAEAIRMHAADARTDPLTGLPNRRALDDELQRRSSEWERKQTPYAVTLVDVDHFKRCNDEYGHAAGDEALRRVAKLLRGSLRDMDFAARFGGEEFCVVHPATTLDEAQAAAERIRKAIAESTIDVSGQKLALTISAGAAQAMVKEDTTQLIARADAALYAAKNAGRNRVRVNYGDSVGPDSTEGFVAAPSDLDEACGELHRRLQEVAGVP